MSGFEIKLDMAGLQLALQQDLQAFGDAARPAAQAGAQVLYDEVRRNVARIGRKTGNLAASIYQAYSEDNSTPGGRATYHVSWNARKAPHGHLVEFGHLQRYQVSYDPKTRRFLTDKTKPLPTPRQVAARPFIRPALSSKAEAAYQAMHDRFMTELQARGVVR